MEKLRQHLANKFQRINVAKTDTEQPPKKGLTTDNYRVFIHQTSEWGNLASLSFLIIRYVVSP